MIRIFAHRFTVLFLSFFLVAAAAVPVFAADALRTWTNTSGQSIEATLIGVEDDSATLRMKSGAKHQVTLSTLREADRVFVTNWQNETAANVQRDVMGTTLGTPTEVIVETAFDEDTPAVRKGEIAGWKAGIGEWRIEDGALIGNELEQDHHASSLTQRFEATHLIIAAQVQLGTADQIAFACRDTVPPNLHLARLYITPEKLWIQHMTGIAKTTKAEKLVTVDVDLDPEKWYDVTIEIIGDHYRATVGDEEIEATHSRFADAKGIVALVNKGQGARYRNVALWHAEPKE